MAKKLGKILGIILMFLVIINIFQMNNIKCYAEGMPDVSEDLTYWSGFGSNYKSGGAGFQEKVSVILAIVRNVGIVASVITLIVIGIRFMLGSVEERAQYKQTLIPWIIGAVLVFSMTTIPSVIYELTEAVFK